VKADVDHLQGVRGAGGRDKLVFVIDSFGRGGSQRVATQLIQHWIEAGRRVRVISFQGPESDFFRVPAEATREVIGGTGVSRHLFSGAVANLRRVMRLRSAFRMSNAPIIVSFLTTTNILVILAAAGLDARVIVCERNDPQKQSFGAVWNWLRWLTYRHADLVTANSRGAVDALKAIAPSRCIAFAPNPLPPPQSDSVAQLTAPTVMTVGRLHPAKGPDVLLRAFALFREKYSGWRLAFVGDGPSGPELRDLAADLGIASAVDWIGEVDDPYPWLRAARIFALPSRHEGMPNSLLEAMACGLPCIVSDSSPGPMEVITDGESGIVAPVEDAAALASALDLLAGNQLLAANLGDAARRRIAEFAPNAALQIWDQMLERVRLPA
jgi:GalNAc-alpha-(1->4)-GalNAc-alpha-(1->3)-diNAcBac-PP-undecaprenol alpha-1,4-N-acetyl-D-galactosaminyltransferase